MIKLSGIILGLWAWSITASYAILSDEALQAFTRDLYQRECASNPANLAIWNPHEAFPSLGIGHFIWLPPGSQAPFEQQFPAMVAFVHSQYPAPSLLRQSFCPWQNATEFHQAWSSEALDEARQWLNNTLELQTKFVIARFEERLKQLKLSSQGQRHLTQLKASPQGLMALMDYAHFKGWGNNPQESYQNQGWGLIQVLEGMGNAETSLALFQTSALARLAERIRKAPRDESHFWQGWQKRIQSYSNPQ